MGFYEAIESILKEEKDIRENIRVWDKQHLWTFTVNIISMMSQSLEGFLQWYESPVMVLNLTEAQMREIALNLFEVAKALLKYDRKITKEVRGDLEPPPPPPEPAKMSNRNLV